MTQLSRFSLTQRMEPLDRVGKEFFHWGLTENPFPITGTSLRFFMQKGQYLQAINAVSVVLRERQGLAAVYGEVGAGKSTTAKFLYDRIAITEGYKVAYVGNPSGTPSQVFSTIVREFGLDPVSNQVSRMQDQLQAFILEETQLKLNNIVLLIDEAQSLRKEALEYIRHLGNFERGEEKLLQVVLFGQTELIDIIKRRGNLWQRVVTHSYLNKLGASEVMDLVNFRLQVVGGNVNVIFDEGALEAFVRYSDGIPRNICKIGFHALVLGAQKDESKISEHTIIQAVKLAGLD
ncbi:MAG: AAA family ATPase [Chloroflexi bacterium]|uniref:AAA family ATPase n=1 Tax=Candidatus Chlorohelix allophototropha TaxID=3003348 RepID=A0A8T7M1U2_9CHLR|nr:AAA family ATPase [Chloroflexota bacterium]WJW65469.1 AAA family ATPase [Chloroflexota bacterium L227-S17]